MSKVFNALSKQLLSEPFFSSINCFADDYDRCFAKKEDFHSVTLPRTTLHGAQNSVNIPVDAWYTPNVMYGV